tara:strand:+ start:29 stop:205 length:177 start_codon:yes stop_codon:yes gene_type:complete
MKVGDLVRVSNNGFTTTGFIRGMVGEYFLVRYFEVFPEENVHSGLWTSKHITVLTELA